MALENLPLASPAGPAIDLGAHADLLAGTALAEILRRYGVIGDAEHAELERLWVDRLAENPARSRKSDAAAQSYRTWLTRK